jgi:phenylalanyl-tRNA synthetase beta chain
VRLVYPWLRDLVEVTEDPERLATELGLRGFEVAEIHLGALPVIDFEITANRPDCLSHVGLAREVSAMWTRPLRLPELMDLPSGPAHRLDVHLEDAELCPRYCAQVFEVAVAPSPAWLAERLHAAGVRPINNIVDVTNYVMLELGQPMHAFDLRRLAGERLVIRRAHAGEPLKTLDGIDRTLDADTLVIADAERATAVAGVMGGGNSEIGPGTTIIALESAYFHPPAVRRSSRKLGLKTEASARFERGGDINAPPIGIARAAALFARIGAGRPLGGLIDRYPVRRTPAVVVLRAPRIERLLGQSVPAAAVPPILTALGFGVEADAGAGAQWRVTVPSFRVDVSREEDLIEEVGRHYAFDELPATFPPLDAPQPAPDASIVRDRLIRQVLTASGFSESMTFAFVERSAALPFCDDGVEPTAIANPLSEKFAVLRPSLLPGLLESCSHNRRRGRKDVRLFEAGSRFVSTGEGRAAAIIWCGSAAGPHWSAPARPVDFFDVKGIAEVLLAALGAGAVEFAPASVPYLVPGRIAEARSQGAVLGVLGQLQPPVAEARGFPPAEEVYVAEVDLDAAAAIAAAGELHGELRTEPLPRFPSIVRDISILIDEALPAATVRGTIRSVAPSTLVSFVEFDRYQGKGVPEGRVSLSIRLTFRAPDRTLTDDEAQRATERIVQTLRQRHAAEQR